jgi:hypothetical protein
VTPRSPGDGGEWVTPSAVLALRGPTAPVGGRPTLVSYLYAPAAGCRQRGRGGVGWVRCVQTTYYTRGACGGVGATRVCV